MKTFYEILNEETGVEILGPTRRFLSGSHNRTPYTTSKEATDGLLAETERRFQLTSSDKKGLVR